MLSADEKEKLERGFAEGEASQRLEGIEQGEPYWTVKARILAGEITFEQGLEEIAAHHRLRACLRSPEQQSKESQVDHLQAGVQLAFTVLP